MIASRHDLLRLQLALASRGFDPGPPGRPWGAADAAALRAFRDRADLAPGTPVGPAELMRLDLDATARPRPRLARATTRAYPTAA